MAKLFIDEIVSHCTHGIDLHSAAVHRRNLPQIRTNLTQPETEKLARVRRPCYFGFQFTRWFFKKVEKGDLLGIIADPFGSEEFDILSPRTGIIIGYTTIPLINEGEALFHIACFKKAKKGEPPINYLQQCSTEEIIYD